MTPFGDDEARRARAALLHLVETIAARPSMYAVPYGPYGHFRAVADFVRGFVCGYEAANGHDCDFALFRDWLVFRCWSRARVPRNYGFDVYVSHLYPDDAARLNGLAELFREFSAGRDVGRIADGIQAELLDVWDVWDCVDFWDDDPDLDADAIDALEREIDAAERRPRT